MITFEEFRDYCKQLKGQMLLTDGRRKPFTVKVDGPRVQFIPASGKPRTASKGPTEEVLNLLAEVGDWSPARYQAITYNSSYILGVAKHQAEFTLTLHSNNYCEVWGRTGWRRVSVASALARSKALTRCIECQGAVRLHVPGPNGAPRAHAEHLEGHTGCSLGHYFSGVRSRHPNPIQSPAPDSEKSIESAIADEDDESAFPEGRESYRLHRKLERDSKLPARVKANRLSKTGKLECEVCSFDFAEAFGDLGEGFIEAHHRVPVHKLGGKTTTKAEDLALVCPNCHRMLHRSDPHKSVEELRELLTERRTHNSEINDGSIRFRKNNF